MSVYTFVDSSSSTETFVTGSHDQFLHVWRWNPKDDSIQCVYKCTGHAFSVESVSTAPDGLQVLIPRTTEKLLTVYRTAINHSSSAKGELGKF